MAYHIPKSVEIFKFTGFIRINSLSRFYARNVIFRRPVKVLNSTNPDSSVSSAETNVSDSIGEKNRQSDFPVLIKKPEDNVVQYEKLQKNDGRFTKLLALLKNRKKREKTGKILLEGKRLINDALETGMKMKALYFTREEDLHEIKLKDPKDLQISKVLYRTMQVWSGLDTCPGIMAVFNRPSADDLHLLSAPVMPLTILCDNIREPGNLGSIIRNAAGAGCENILLTKGCVDPWELKVLRAGSGGHFRIPIVNNIEWNQITNYIPSNSTIVVADNNADIHSEAISSDFITYDEKEETEEEEVKYVTLNEHDQPIRVDETFDSKTEIEDYDYLKLPCYLYSAVKYPKNNLVLYIGGETHGVDNRIVKLMCEYGGMRVKIPLENGMNSLNSAFAMTVVLYEIKRQQSRVYSIKKVNKVVS